LAGYLGGSVINCQATGNIKFRISTPYSTSTLFVGGLVGYVESGNLAGIFDSSASVITTAISGTNTTIYVAGITGAQQTGKLENSFSTGNVIGQGDRAIYSGGIVGQQRSGSIKNCFATNQVSASASYNIGYAGGIAGYQTGGTIENCYAVCDINSTKTSLVINYAGGLVAYQNGGTILNSFSKSNVSAISINGTPSHDEYAGHLIGFQNNGSLTASYFYDGQIIIRRDGATTINTPSNTLGAACTLLELNSTIFFTDTLVWDSNVWKFDGLDFVAGKYPTLKKETL
jgi:hypothetical protein